MIDITYRRDDLSPDVVARLADTLLATLLSWERAPDNDASRSLAWAFTHAVEDLRVAGDPDGGPYVRVSVTTPEGALDDPRRGGLVDEVTAEVLAAIGAPYTWEHANRVWVQLHEIAEGSWGAAGRIWRIADIAHFVTTGEPPMATARQRPTIAPTSRRTAKVPGTTHPLPTRSLAEAPIGLSPVLTPAGRQ
jgi:phenylpyruvate tautomerase PptA (4-oxalocrotonate tautomerase family)